MDLKTLKSLPPWEWPEGTEAMLLDILTNSQTEESDRLLATILASEVIVINDKLADTLLSIIQNDNATEEQRACAALSLGPVLEYTFEEEFEELDDVIITEKTYNRIHEMLHTLYIDTTVPKEVRRRILEASARAPQEWHQDAIRAAYLSTDRDWKMTAMFSMCWVQGFDELIMEALNSDDEDIHFQAVCAAGSWEIDEAWVHVSELVSSDDAEKKLRLAAIDALVGIRPHEAEKILLELTDSDDGDIVDAAHEALAMVDMYI